MFFLGSCSVCGKKVRTYRGLGQHLRFNTDKPHQELKRRWYAWRDQYSATLRCRKCGSLWVISDPKHRHDKWCPRCEGLRQSMSKRGYEKLVFEKPAGPRQLMADSGSACSHIMVWLPRLKVGECLYRTWHPAVERS